MISFFSSTFIFISVENGTISNNSNILCNIVPFSFPSIFSLLKNLGLSYDIIILIPEESSVLLSTLLIFFFSIVVIALTDIFSNTFLSLSSFFSFSSIYSLYLISNNFCISLSILSRLYIYPSIPILFLFISEFSETPESKLLSLYILIYSSFKSSAFSSKIFTFIIFSLSKCLSKLLTFLIYIFPKLSIVLSSLKFEFESKTSLKYISISPSCFNIFKSFPLFCNIAASISDIITISI